jgi:hypothetical protein
MSMNKLLLNIVVSALSITSISYGSDDDLGTPHEVGSTSQFHHCHCFKFRKKSGT